MEQPGAPVDRTLVGQLLLPEGSGSRGMEILVTARDSAGEERVVWVLFDERGHFSHTYQDSLALVRVRAGIERDVRLLEAEDLPEIDQAGRVDLGVIDLREHLEEHRVMLREAIGSLPGVVRVGMWFGVPGTGPQGEPVSLGSRQFNEIDLGSEVEWLLPSGAESIYFLVERPSGAGRGKNWWSGHQRLFGPFTSDEMPAELRMD
jgi:hypothetical protein